jgi:ferrous iron transport protein B
VNAESLTFPKVALAGPPNCGKTALFNALTGGRQKVANYPGVTVERKEGLVQSKAGNFRVLDLPGTYSLDARTPDEEITRDVLLGRHASEIAPETIIAVADATNLERNLGLVIELRHLKRNVVLALNMMDLAEQRGLHLDLGILSRELGVPVVPTVATKRKGLDALVASVQKLINAQKPTAAARAEDSAHIESHMVPVSGDAIRERFTEIDRVLKLATRTATRPALWSARIDHWVVHPVAGPVILLVLFALVFQAVFTWASVPADWIEAGLGWLGTTIGSWLPDGALRSLIVDGVIAGVGAVLVFVPQILLLYAFILLLEDSGYMARAAFLMDRTMGRLGLHGRAFIPLLSSFACAIPGIMATRTIENRRDRLITILVAPLMTCSARLPVYALLIAAFIPNQKVIGFFGLQGLVMLALYLAGVASALVSALVMKRTALKGPTPPLLLELPTYKIPDWRNLLFGLRDRVALFVHRAGTVILAVSVVLWFLSSYPAAPENSPEPPIYHSYAGKLGRAIAPAIEPIGLNWQIGIALIPGFAAREVAVSALGTVYAVQGSDEDKTSEALQTLLPKSWSLATALSLLAWYIFAPQCLSTLAVTRRETNSWKWPLVMLVYLTALAYAGSFVVYHFARAMGWG